MHSETNSPGITLCQGYYGQVESTLLFTSLSGTSWSHTLDRSLESPVYHSSWLCSLHLSFPFWPGTLRNTLAFVYLPLFVQSIEHILPKCQYLFTIKRTGHELFNRRDQDTTSILTSARLTNAHTGIDNGIRDSGPKRGGN